MTKPGRTKGKGLYALHLRPGEGIPGITLEVRAKSWEHAIELGSKITARIRNNVWDDLEPEERAAFLETCEAGVNRIEHAFGVGIVMSATFVEPHTKPEEKP